MKSHRFWQLMAGAAQLHPGLFHKQLSGKLFTFPCLGHFWCVSLLHHSPFGPRHGGGGWWFFDEPNYPATWWPHRSMLKFDQTTRVCLSSGENGRNAEFDVHHPIGDTMHWNHHQEQVKTSSIRKTSTHIFPQKNAKSEPYPSHSKSQASDWDINELHRKIHFQPRRSGQAPDPRMRWIKGCPGRPVLYDAKSPKTAATCKDESCGHWQFMSFVWTCVYIYIYTIYVHYISIQRDIIYDSSYNSIAPVSHVWSEIPSHVAHVEWSIHFNMMITGM